MYGVDKLDQLVSYYSFLHKSVKWWRKIFFWCLEVAVVNSYIIHQMKADKPLTHIAYRREIVEELSEPLRSSCRVRSRPGPQRSQHMERLLPVRHFSAKGEKYRDCAVCSERRPGKRRTTLHYCSTCSDMPYLCPSGCFESYHTKKHYK